MTSRVKVGWRVPAPIWHRFTERVAEKWGSERGHVGAEIEQAMLEYLDRDGLLAECEALLREYTDLRGLSSSRAPTGTDRYQDQDSKLVNNRIDAGLKEEFQIYADEHDVAYGRLLAAALDAHADGGRARRILDDVRRLVTDGDGAASRVEAESAAEESPPADASGLEAQAGTEESPEPDPGIVLSVAAALGQSFTAGDVADLLADHVDAAAGLDPGSELVAAYTDAVVSHLDVVPHPNPENDLFIPPAQRESLTVYDDLTREARIEELRRYVALDAVQARKSHYAVGYSEVQTLFERHCVDKRGPSHQYAYDLMEDAAEADGYNYREGRDGTLQLRVAVSETPPRIREWLADHPDVALSTADGGEGSQNSADLSEETGAETDTDAPADTPDAAPVDGDADADGSGDGDAWIGQAVDALPDYSLIGVADLERAVAEATGQEADAVTPNQWARVVMQAGLVKHEDIADAYEWPADTPDPAADADAELDRFDSAQAVRTDGGRPPTAGRGGD